MPRYHFDVRSNFATTEDLDGMELSDIAAAKAEALKVGAGLTPTYASGIMIEVVDQDLRPVPTIPTSDQRQTCSFSSEKNQSCPADFP